MERIRIRIREIEDRIRIFHERNITARARLTGIREMREMEQRNMNDFA